MDRHIYRGWKCRYPVFWLWSSVSCLTYCSPIYNKSGFVCFAWLNVRIRAEDPRVHFTWQKLWRETEKVTLFFIWFDKGMFTHLHKISFCRFSFLFLFPCILIMSIVWFSFRLLLSFDFSQFRSIFPFASFLSNTFKSSCVRFANWKCHIKWDKVHFNQPIFSSLSTFSLPWRTNLVTRCTAWLPSSLWSACGLSFTTY